MAEHFEGNAVSNLIEAVGGAFAFKRELGQIGLYQCSAPLSLTTSYQDVAGCTTGTFTPDGDEYAYVWSQVLFNCIGGTAAVKTGDALVGAIDVYYSAASHIETVINGIIPPSTAADGTNFVSGAISTVRYYRIALTSGTEYTIKTQARNVSGARGEVIEGTQMIVWRVPAVLPSSGTSGTPVGLLLLITTP